MMFEPEIDRRCVSCGAAVRQSAAFCPQCGQMLEKRDSQQIATVGAEEADQTEEVDQTEGEFIEAISSPELPTNDGNEDDQSAASEPSQIEVTPIVGYREENDGNVTATVAESSRATLHDDPKAYATQPLSANPTLSTATVADLAESNFRRPGDVAPPRKERQVLARVDKIRKVSTGMIDQAAYDPSLRFLLVAGVLFVVFVILMILSKVLG